MGGDQLEIRVHGADGLPALIYLPGVHGDWTLISSFRTSVAGRVRFVEFIYPRMGGWPLSQHAREIAKLLKEHGIQHGWLLAESFGSQIAWEMLSQGFSADGLILAGGFVRHPLLIEAELGRWLGLHTPRWLLRMLLKGYRHYARFRHRQAPETLAAIDEFGARRNLPGERQALAHRLELIIESDFTGVARTARIPVFHLSGLWDPIVPWWAVLDWLRRECRPFQGHKVIWGADHAVLATQPKKSAEQVLAWMGKWSSGDRPIGAAATS